MDFKNSYDMTIYEVLSEDLKKYTSTSVSGSGGGGFVSGSGGHISDVNISSTTNYHSDQIIWLKNLQSGAEERVEFKSFNIEARAGHKLLFVRDKRRDGMLERIVNINTGKMFNAYGCYNNSPNGRGGFTGRFLVPLGYALVFSIPFVSVVHAITAFFVNVIGGRGFWVSDAHVPSAMSYGLIGATMSSIMFYFTLSFMISGKHIMDVLGLSIVYFFVYILYFFLTINIEYSFVTKQGKLLDDYLVNYVKELNLKT